MVILVVACITAVSFHAQVYTQLLFKKEMRKIDKENKWKNRTIRYNKIIFTCRFA